MKRLTLAVASAALFTMPAHAQTAAPEAPATTAPTTTEGAAGTTGAAGDADMTAAVQSAMEEGGLTDVQPMDGAMVYSATAPGGVPVTVIVGGSGMSGGGAMSTGGAMGTTGTGSSVTPAPAN